MTPRIPCLLSRSERQRRRLIGWTITFLAVLLTIPAWAAEPEPLPIRLNTVGYPLDAKKEAAIAAPGTNFTVVRLSDNRIAYAGKVTGPVLNPDTQ